MFGIVINVVNPKAVSHSSEKCQGTGGSCEEFVPPKCIYSGQTKSRQMVLFCRGGQTLGQGVGSPSLEEEFPLTTQSCFSKGLDLSISKGSFQPR